MRGVVTLLAGAFCGVLWWAVSWALGAQAYGIWGRSAATGLLAAVVTGIAITAISTPLYRRASAQALYWYSPLSVYTAIAIYGLAIFLFRHFIDDFRDVLRGSIGEMPMPRPRGLDLFFFLTGKAAFVVMAFIVPSLVHGVVLAVAFYLVTSIVVGVCLSVIFQLAHCVEDAAFYPGTAVDEWARHQITTTANFAPGSRVLGWFVGGLNFQIEHHLFPRISHAHYARIAPAVQHICAERGVPYHVHETFTEALRSHYRLLRANGRFNSEF